MKHAIGEQRLVDVCFEVAMRFQINDIKFKTREECAAWVTRQLDAAGFKTKPRGMSWGVLE